MAKRPDTTETVVLALELLRRIPRDRYVTASKLHEELSDIGIQRDLRTVQRQLEMLSERFDVERDERSRPYGYRLKKMAQGMAVPTLSDQDSLLLTLAEQHLRHLLPAGLLKSMEGFFTQARSNLAPHGKARRPREWLSKVRVVSESQPLLAPAIKPGVFEAVSNALYGNFWLELDYKNSAGKQSRADVMPLGLAQQGTRLYLVCRYRGYQNERSLALHRIIDATVSPHVFERPQEFDLERYDDDGRFGFGNGKQIRLQFHIDKPAGYHLLESPLSACQTVTEHDETYEICATVVDSARLDWWLNGFGAQVSGISKL